MVRTTARILDEYLVASARAGDRRSMEQLVQRWQARLVAHAWRLTGDFDGAHEAAQLGWIEIGRGLGRLQDGRAFPAWAYRIVSRICARQVGDAIGRRRLAEAVAAQPEVGPAEIGGELDAARLRAAIRALPPEQRAAVALFYFEDMGVAEVAVALNVPAGTVKTRLMHARRKLRAALEGES
ncbi:RNA polymerase sigma factor [Sphingosinicella rhizophila]|uniref:RNA polymerase sigma factor n=1 Tax=Sphingosinicella rhizophila TaxID=3050082 RepID=A0ABU3Q9U2_9SPHN|nr:RNA polymerase sigma factor [Sphingosinicella sp. GR2756]MDT9600180.1 RNA polymerase sigma factor [Sphingosinicella sp. GR2756]